MENSSAGTILMSSTIRGVRQESVISKASDSGQPLEIASVSRPCTGFSEPAKLRWNPCSIGRWGCRRSTHGITGTSSGQYRHVFFV